MELITDLIAGIQKTLDNLETLVNSTSDKTQDRLERIIVVYLGTINSQIPMYSSNFHYFGYSYKYGIVRVSCQNPGYKSGDLLSGTYHDKQNYLCQGTIHKIY
jgi:hypothetical protein